MGTFIQYSSYDPRSEKNRKDTQFISVEMVAADKEGIQQGFHPGSILSGHVYAIRDMLASILDDDFRHELAKWMSEGLADMKGVDTVAEQRKAKVTAQGSA